MSRIRLRILAALVLAVLSLFAAACGGDDEEGDEGGTTTAEDAPAEGKKGGKLTQLSASDVDYLDPGHTYYTAGLQVAAATHTQLYGFKPGDTTNVVPMLAESDPQISDDNTTVTVKLRQGIKFGPPVNRDVEAKDVKYAIERFFSQNVGGQYTAYLDALEGAPEKPTKGVKEISGITVQDPQTIVFKLAEPTAAGFAAALVMPVTAGVPEEYAKEFDAKNPSTYNTHVVSSGPYMVANNAEGELTGYSPGKSIQLVRNPNWDASVLDSPAYLDEVELRLNVADANVSGRQVLEGSALVMGENPPAPVLQRAVQRYKEQIGTLPGGGFRYFPMNSTIKPLDDVNVRKAISAAFDRDAARKARGGEFVGPIANHYLPPGIAGHEEAGGLEGPGFDFLANPKGDLNLAKEYMKKAGYSSGLYDGNEELLMVTANVDPNKAQAEVARAQMEKLGFKITFRTVPQDAVYTEWCQVPAKKVAVCGGAGWFKDFPDPQSMLEPTFKGSEINLDGGNNNLAQLDVPEIDKAMEAAERLSGEERAQAYGEVDKMITEQAPAVPFVWDNTNILFASDVAFVGNAMFNSADLAYTSLK
jgi:peptide/nickel transport system substrate-binding protein